MAMSFVISAARRGGVDDGDSVQFIPINVQNERARNNDQTQGPPAAWVAQWAAVRFGLLYVDLRLRKVRGLAVVAECDDVGTTDC